MTDKTEFQLVQDAWKEFEFNGCIGRNAAEGVLAVVTNMKEREALKEHELTKLRKDSQRLTEIAAQKADRCDELHAVVSEMSDMLYGQGFEVANWHLNGDMESMDNFFEENNWLTRIELEAKEGE